MSHDLFNACMLCRQFKYYFGLLLLLPRNLFEIAKCLFLTNIVTYIATYIILLMMIVVIQIEFYIL